MKRDFVVALEEHYWDRELSSQFKERGPEMRIPALQERLFDLGELRLREMDEAGIDLQVLSHGAPAVQRLDAESAVRISRSVNDRLHQTVQKHAARFAAFAVLPTADPKAAADELERCVTQLGFKGAMIHSHQQGEFLDARKYWVMWERAERLDVPIYLHPALPHPGVVKAYFDGYEELARAPWGFAVDTSCHFLRLVFSGLFDAYPKLKIILGHLGEMLPFAMHRLNDHSVAAAKVARCTERLDCPGCVISDAEWEPILDRATWEWVGNMLRARDGTRWPASGPGPHLLTGPVFCGLCGSCLWLWDPRWPELVHPFASAIDTALPQPLECVHMMLASKANWVRLEAHRGLRVLEQRGQRRQDVARHQFPEIQRLVVDVQLGEVRAFVQPNDIDTAHRCVQRLDGSQQEVVGERTRDVDLLESECDRMCIHGTDRDREHARGGTGQSEQHDRCVQLDEPARIPAKVLSDALESKEVAEGSVARFER